MGEHVAGSAGTGSAEGFATLLRELKDRSGLSYGTLAKRLHMSTSTLHRYCNGAAVPNDYAPVERLARVCRATPQELVELHRRWVLADAARAAASQVRRESGEAGAGVAVLAAGEPDAAEPGETAGAPGADTQDASNEPEEPVVVSMPGASAVPRRRRTVLVASAAAAVLVASVLAARAPWAGDSGTSTTGNLSDAGNQKTVNASVPQDTPTPNTPGPSTPRAGATGDRPTAETSTTPGAAAPHTSAAPIPGSAAVPLTVRTRPYVYDNPCSQRFLVDSAPAQMGPPANEENAPRWAASYGAVSSDEQRVALTVQGTGSQTVVLEALHVSIVSRNAPLAWNDYAMGVGCGGGVETKSFDVDLDSGSPTVTVKNGQRDFPYSVSQSDPEVFYVTAHTKAHDVRWSLTLDWSSGTRHGTVRADNDGTPFRTSAGADRPGYDYPLGGSDWIPRAP
ncbi:helix-turn-helix transcriptional regulator [Streptomyces sp. RKAG293]|uniref:helix-turn-helix domain-containing protein n=1 Tax=Streptomyces sp. RKAG293 TaxID=2893403 RepID=UPI0025567DB6